jgi:hypothetical protein
MIQPYATNPSFRPPPPLSNDMMIKLDAELRSGKRTIGQISQAYSISKHRLDAIRKLKEVEEEFVRQVSCPVNDFGGDEKPNMTFFIKTTHPFGATWLQYSSLPEPSSCLDCLKHRADIDPLR